MGLPTEMVTNMLLNLKGSLTLQDNQGNQDSSSYDVHCPKAQFRVEQKTASSPESSLSTNSDVTALQYTYICFTKRRSKFLSNGKRKEYDH